ncbi:Uncharacterised protein [Bifidobacterium longum subsp. infantis]|uniref:DUF4422 domain-containing protein n=1 Tax=Bifidobacterium longum subsp. infantis TaxID=1682 RepID=A0A564VUK8_BIFLI|nr:DUF4422 domain-containing protein [Bifidobacterium longum]VUX36225.1 Uncharacterised protein [Bifidobacterium longum subsp. infantis]
MTHGDVCVAVAAHKQYRMPDDPIYLPVQVGKALHEDVNLGFVGDDTGDSISGLNAWYSELTALYWIWKNIDSRYKGLVHYRRHFAARHSKPLFSHDRFDCIIGGDEIRTLLDRADILVPKKRKYYIETIYSHYAHTLPVEQLDETRKILAIDAPEYVPAFDTVMRSRGAHMFNMFIMSQGKMDEYCSFLFPVLHELVQRINPDKYGDAFQARYPGRISEMLLDVWLLTKGYSYIEVPTLSPEPVNWLKKGSSFLLAKFGLKKYSHSF